jgi:hypothetical protein
VTNVASKENPERAADGGDTRGTYLLTIRRVRFERDEAESFRDYFRSVALAGFDVLVVDGSPPEVFAAHAEVWHGSCRHAPVDPQFKYLNGKVNGIHTGVAISERERIILADDDIRYTPDTCGGCLRCSLAARWCARKTTCSPCRFGRGRRRRACSSTGRG